MEHILLERPRLRPPRKRPNRAIRSLRRLARIDPEAAPQYRGMRRPHGGRHGIEAKALNENLSPLKRFLESRVGQPWNRVFSEIAARVRPTSATQLHILTHVRELVCEAPEMRGGVPYRLSGYPVGRLWRGSLYVEPGTGILRRTPDHRRIGERAATIDRLP